MKPLFKERVYPELFKELLCRINGLKSFSEIHTFGGVTATNTVSEQVKWTDWIGREGETFPLLFWKKQKKIYLRNA